MNLIPDYRPVEKGVSIVGEDAYKDYKKTSKVRDYKKFKSKDDYRRITRKIWKKIAHASMDYESGVYVKGFLYLIPQVIDNKTFVQLPGGNIKNNRHTKGDIFTPIFANIFEKLNHFAWSLDGCFVETYKKRLTDTINRELPRYYFILPSILKNKL